MQVLRFGLELQTCVLDSLSSPNFDLLLNGIGIIISEQVIYLNIGDIRLATAFSVNLIKRNQFSFIVRHYARGVDKYVVGFQSRILAAMGKCLCVSMARRGSHFFLLRPRSASITNKLCI